MAKRVGQIRWFGVDSVENYPSSVSLESLRQGSAFPRSYPIVQLGIQTVPGTKVYLNSSITPIIIGATGIYELNVDGLTQITSIQFDPASLQIIEERPGAYIIIDYIYEETE